jgi:hypothetical protein
LVGSDSTVTGAAVAVGAEIDTAFGAGDMPQAASKKVTARTSARRLTRSMFAPHF